ncbi:MAG: carboxylesterase/lipase family protein [Caulobacterales bacterium]
MHGLALAATMVAMALAAAASAQTVRTEGGELQGTTADGLTVFKAIPFAAPPVGDLRWRAPQPAKPWTGVKSADAFAPVCTQSAAANTALGLPVLASSEDCLYLNVWSPAKSAAERLPVMVWIYGGGFTSGGTALPTYSGEFLAKKGVVVVSIAYRLGPFGFLAHPELSKESGHGSGTYGLLDQIAGLKWVKQNIAAFGGDPTRVTIFGESAGGISVSMLAASPLAKGLFQRAISESGGSFAPPRFANEGGTNVPPLSVAEQTGASYLKALGAVTIADARKLSADAVLNGPAGAAPGGGPRFWPVMDGYVIPADQYGLYEAGKYNDTPILIGTNGDEGALFVRGPVDAAKYVAGIKAQYGDYADKVLAAYPGDTDAAALRSSRDLFRESAFSWHTWTWARLQARTGKGKVFIYVFSHRPPYPDIPALKDWGAAHGSEIAYVLGTMAASRGMGWTDADRALSDQIQTYWSNFAKTGDPNGPGLPPWPAFTNAAPAMMHFDGAPQAGPIANLDKLQAMDGYYAWLRSKDHEAPAGAR